MTVTKEILQDKMRKPHVVVLNVQPEGDFQERHILGSHNIPYLQDQTLFAQSVEMKFGREKFFIVYGPPFPSPTANDAALALRKRGLWAEAYPGGLADWKEAGLPTVGDHPALKGVHP
jgi:rhodanese-related sulfurtransferase